MGFNSGLKGLTLKIQHGARFVFSVLYGEQTATFALYVIN
jgi:hypothetical protein